MSIGSTLSQKLSDFRYRCDYSVRSSYRKLRTTPRIVSSAFSVASVSNFAKQCYSSLTTLFSGSLTATWLTGALCGFLVVLALCPNSMYKEMSVASASQPLKELSTRDSPGNSPAQPFLLDEFTGKRGSVEYIHSVDSVGTATNGEDILHASFGVFGVVQQHEVPEHDLTVSFVDGYRPLHDPNYSRVEYKAPFDFRSRVLSGSNVLEQLKERRLLHTTFEAVDLRQAELFLWSFLISHDLSEWKLIVWMEHDWLRSEDSTLTLFINRFRYTPYGAVEFRVFDMEDAQRYFEQSLCPDNHIRIEKPLVLPVAVLLMHGGSWMNPDTFLTGELPSMVYEKPTIRIIDTPAPELQLLHIPVNFREEFIALLCDNISEKIVIALNLSTLRNVVASNSSDSPAVDGEDVERLSLPNCVYYDNFILNFFSDVREGGTKKLPPFIPLPREQSSGALCVGTSQIDVSRVRYVLTAAVASASVGDARLAPIQRAPLWMDLLYWNTNMAKNPLDRRIQQHDFLPSNFMLILVASAPSHFGERGRLRLKFAPLLSRHASHAYHLPDLSVALMFVVPLPQNDDSLVSRLRYESFANNDMFLIEWGIVEEICSWATPDSAKDLNGPVPRFVQLDHDVHTSEGSGLDLLAKAKSEAETRDRRSTPDGGTMHSCTTIVDILENKTLLAAEKSQRSITLLFTAAMPRVLARLETFYIFFLKRDDVLLSPMGVEAFLRTVRRARGHRQFTTSLYCKRTKHTHFVMRVDPSTPGRIAAGARTYRPWVLDYRDIFSNETAEAGRGKHVYAISADNKDLPLGWRQAMKLLKEFYALCTPKRRLGFFQQTNLTDTTNLMETTTNLTSVATRSPAISHGRATRNTPVTLTGESEWSENDDPVEWVTTKECPTAQLFQAMKNAHDFAGDNRKAETKERTANAMNQTKSKREKLFDTRSFLMTLSYVSPLMPSGTLRDHLEQSTYGLIISRSLASLIYPPSSPQHRGFMSVTDEECTYKAKMINWHLSQKVEEQVLMDLCVKGRRHPINSRIWVPTTKDTYHPDRELRTRSHREYEPWIPAFAPEDLFLYLLPAEALQFQRFKRDLYSGDACKRPDNSLLRDRTLNRRQLVEFAGRTLILTNSTCPDEVHVWDLLSSAAEIARSGETVETSGLFPPWAIEIQIPSSKSTLQPV